MVVVVAATWRRHDSSSQFAAVAALVASLLQIALAQVGSLDRYESYLIAIAVIASLRFADESGLGGPTSSRRWMATAAVASVLVALAGYQHISLSTKAPVAARDVYDQKYLAGEFLALNYPARPIASGELGWISWNHQGPFTDLLGLGDYEVLQQLRAHGGLLPSTYLEDLAGERGFDVVVMYPQTTAGQTPNSWVYVGAWVLHRRTLTAFNRRFEFWATRPESVAPMITQLRRFAPHLPVGERLEISPLALLRARALASG
jgi:hypothetical protein